MQVPGYHEMLTELGDWLIDITGFDAISLQPNAVTLNLTLA